MIPGFHPPTERAVSAPLDYAYLFIYLFSASETDPTTQHKEAEIQPQFLQLVRVHLSYSTSTDSNTDQYSLVQHFKAYYNSPFDRIMVKLP